MNESKKTTSEFSEAIPQNISYIGLFRYATWLEVLATFSGVLVGVFSGFGICYNMIQFGEMCTSFVERTAHPGQTSSVLPLLKIFGGGRILTNATYEENMSALLEDAQALTFGMAISISVSFFLCFVSIALINWSAQRQISKLHYLLLESVIRQDMSWYDTDQTFDFASRMAEDVAKIKEGIGEKMGIVANLIGTGLIAIIAVIPLGWELALACLSVVPFSIACSYALTWYQTRSSVRMLDSYSQAGKQAEEVLKSIRTVVAYGGEQIEVIRYRHRLEPAERYGRKRGLYSGVGIGFNWILTYTLNAIGVAYGTQLVLADANKSPEDRVYNVGKIFSILYSVYMATQSITLSVPHAEAFSSAKAAAKGIFAMLEKVPKIDSLNKRGSKPKNMKGVLVFENVTFSYPSRPNIKILENFSLGIRPGESVALVGPSGCGKSTVLQLIQRLYDPQIGGVSIDCRDVRNLQLHWLRSSLGVVGQEPVLFQGTIKDNICIGLKHDVPLEVIEKAAEIAFAKDFIKSLPNGYDTIIGERGSSLSGGQKQRIAIARALLRDPAVLLLDEPTSALDPHSERRVQAALDRAAHGRTTVTVSHRLSTIINCDRIVCMEKGKIVEQGTHKDLLKLNGFYAKLLNANHEKVDTETATRYPVCEDGDNAIQNTITLKRRSSENIKKSFRKDRNEPSMMPRGSISSAMSAGLTNFTSHYEQKDSTDQDLEEDCVKLISDWRLMKLNGPEWVSLLIGSIAAFIQGACFPVFAVLFGFCLGAFSSTDQNEITRLSIIYSCLFVVVAFIAGFSMCLQSVTFTNAGLKMTTRLRINYFAALLKQEMGYFDNQNNTVGALCARLSGDAAEVQNATGLRVGLLIQGFSSLFIGFVMAMNYSWKLTLVGTAFFPLMVGSVWLEGLFTQKSQALERKAMETAISIASETVSNIRTVQSLGVEESFLLRFQVAVRAASAAVSEKTRWRGLVLGLGVYAPILSYVVAVVYGAVLVAKEGLEYKVVILVNEAIMFGAYMLGQSLVNAPGFRSAKFCASKILSLIEREPLVKTEQGLKDKRNWRAKGNVDFKQVDFNYPSRPDTKILDGINLTIEAGKTIALVGGSGSGKSTVLQLLQRFYDPSEGVIDLDEKDSRFNINLDTLRRQLGVVQQEPVLFDRTISENIAYGDNTRKVNMHEVISAARAANIHEFITSLPKGYETRLGSGGAQLSGGQKQRVCIARALVRSPRLLLLDEATSALDANSEKTVSEALQKVAKGLTCITIAHRLTTIKDADVIYVLHKGKIVEKGTHSELLALRGHYYQMSKTLM